MSLADQFAADAGISSATPISSLSDQFAADAAAHEGMSHLESGNPNPVTIQNFLGNLGAGAVKGASQIGSTLIAPADWTGLTGKTNTQRRAEVTSGLQDLGANPNSFPYKAGEIGSEIAGTAGLSGMIAKGVGAIPAIASNLPKLAPAIESGGFSLGSNTGSGIPTALANTLTRAIGGATVGGISAGLVDPSQSTKGAVIGAAVPLAAQTAGLIGRGLGSVVKGTLGTTTGTSGSTIGEAFNAGQNSDRTFLQNMRGQVPFDDIVDQAKAGLNQMRVERAATYRSGMQQVSNDKTVLDLQPIQDAVKNLKSLGSFKGQAINKNASGIVQDLSDQVNNWASLDPAEYHTPEGLDALKQSIGDIRDSTEFGSSGRRAADTVYNAVKTQINKQAPIYAKVMKDYTDASNTLNEVTKGFSLGEKASNDTAVRKLQSLLRNNVQTNYGNRVNLASQLQQQGGINLMPAIAGQGLNSWMPRGLMGTMEKGGGIMAAILKPSTLALAPFASPRLVGESAYGVGKLVPSLSPSNQSLSGALSTALPSIMFSR